MAYLMFVMLCAIWGSSFILMKLATDTFGPISVGTWRALGGAAAMALVWRVMPRDKRRGIPRKDWPALAVPIVIGMAYPWAMQPYLIDKHRNSAFFGMMVCLVPLITILVSIPLLRVWPGFRQVAGVIVGLACFASLIHAGDEIGVPVADVLLAATVPTLYAFSNTYVKRRFALTEPVGFTAVTLLAAGLVMLPIGLAIEPIRAAPLETLWRSIGALAVLGTLGTGLATLLFFRLVQTRGPLFAGMVTYIVPLGALKWGWLHGEAMTGKQILALLGILGAVALVQWPRRRRLG